MKRDSILGIITVSITIFLLAFSVFYGCAKKMPPTGISKETPEGAKPETKGEVPAGEITGEEVKSQMEEEALEGEVAGRDLASKIQAQMVDINFEFDEFTLTDTARDKLSQNASVLLKNPDINVLIEGHCDERGTEEYNMALGERRANAAKQYLVTLGITESRISTISYGEENPLDPEHNEVAWAKNRRDHFVISVK